jgi:hypothetical protein
MSTLAALFLFMDGVMKLMKPEMVVKATVELGYPESVILELGIVLLICASSMRFRSRRFSARSS